MVNISEKVAVCLIARHSTPIEYLNLCVRGGAKLIDYQADRLVEWCGHSSVPTDIFLLTDIKNIQTDAVKQVIYTPELPTSFDDLIALLDLSSEKYKKLLTIRCDAIFLTEKTFKRFFESDAYAVSAIRSTNVNLALGGMAYTDTITPSDVILSVPLDYKQREISLIQIPNNENRTIVSQEDFELTLALFAKEERKKNLLKTILNRIEEKKASINDNDSDKICLIGHSQIDKWDIEELGGQRVVNAGINGISVRQYIDNIVDKGLLSYRQSKYVLIFGTNDLIYDLTNDEICKDIMYVIDKIESKHPGAQVYLINCLPVLGRMDRNNQRIEDFNVRLAEVFAKRVKMITTDAFKDEYGDLKASHTVDGLHLSDEGYILMKRLIEKELTKQ